MRKVSVGTQVLLLSEHTAQKREDPGGAASCSAAARATSFCTRLLLQAKSSGLLQRERVVLPQGAYLEGSWAPVLVVHTKTDIQRGKLHAHSQVSDAPGIIRNCKRKRAGLSL